MTVENNGTSAEAAESTPAPLSAEDEAAISGGEFTEEEIAQLRGEPKAAETGQAASEGGEEAPQEAKDGADESERSDTKTVPIHALHEARIKLKALTEEVGKFREWQNAIAQRLIEQRSQQERVEQESQNHIPDENQDPIAALGWTKQRLAEFERREAEREQQRQQAVQQETQNQETIARADQVLNEAIRADPVVAEAFQFASKAIAEELQKKGYYGPALQQEFNRQVLSYAMYAPADPAEMREYAYRNARYWGWTPQPPQQSDAKGPAKTSDNIEKLEKLQSAVNASKTLSGGGAANGGEMTLADLEGMTGEELERFASANPDLFERVTGIK